MNAVDVIRAKRDGGTLTDEQIRWFMAAYTAGEVADEQASALLMAIFWRGFEPGELATWTAAMIESRRAPRPVGGDPADRRQALDRWCRRQGLA